MMSSIHQGLFGERWQEGGRGKGKLAFSWSPKQLPLIQPCVIKYYCCSWQMEPNWSSWLRGQPLRNSGHLNLPEAIHTSPLPPPPRASSKTEIVCGCASKNTHSNGQEQLPLVKCSIVYKTMITYLTISYCFIMMPICYQYIVECVLQTRISGFAEFYIIWKCSVHV